MMKVKFVPFKRHQGTRLNNYLRLAFEYFKIDEDFNKYLDSGSVFVNGKKTSDSHYYLLTGDYIEIESDTLTQITPPEIKILFENENICVIDKPSGLHSVDAIRPAPWPLEEILRWNKTPSRAGENFVAAIHRLDVDTSGVIVFALNRETASIFGKAIQNRETKKEYYAVVSPPPEKESFINDEPIGYDTSRPGFWMCNGKNAKEALSHFEVIQKSNDYALLRCTPHTGRTHQLRVHLSHLKTSIVGDNIYGGIDYSRLMLHCSMMEFTTIDSENSQFKAPLPEEFKKILGS